MSPDIDLLLCERYPRSLYFWSMCAAMHRMGKSFQVGDGGAQEKG